MSNYDDDDLDYEDSNAIQQLRKAKKADEKRIAELTERLAKFEAKERESNLSSLLEQRGLNPKIAKFIPGDVVDESAVTAWLDDYADVFGGGKTEQNVADQPAEASVPGYDPAVNTAFNNTASQGFPPSSDESQQLAQIAGAKTVEDLNRILFGNPNGPTVS